MPSIFSLIGSGNKQQVQKDEQVSAGRAAIDKRTNEVIKVKFSTKDCGICPSRLHCIRSRKKYQRRTITIGRQQAYQALQAARQRERTEEFAAVYAKRAGIEGTLSRGIRTCKLRRTRYVGLGRVRLGHLLTAAAINFLRLGEWFAEMPSPKTRRPPFVRLMEGRETLRA